MSNPKNNLRKAIEAASDIEYIPVEQAAGAPKSQTSYYRPAYLFPDGKGNEASAEIELYGLSDTDIYTITLRVTAASPLQAIDEMMTAIREAKRIYHLSPIRPDIDNPKPIE